MKNVAIYVRENQAHAWKFERADYLEGALLAREVNTNFGVETLIVPLQRELPQFLDSYQTQSDFREVINL